MRPLFIAILPLLASCSTATQVPNSADYPGTLAPPSQLGFSVQWRQTVTADFNNQTRSFEAVVVQADDTLTLMMLGPMDSVGMVVTQNAGGVTIDDRMGLDLPLKPRWIMLDIQRVFFPSAAASKAPDGTQQFTRDGETITEVRRKGQLLERRFERVDGIPKGTITIRYSAHKPGQTAPGSAHLVNGWFGYALTIKTHSETRLD
jgi:hypothetical protein